MLLHCRAARPELTLTLTQGQMVPAAEHQYPTLFLALAEARPDDAPRGGGYSGDQEGIEREALHGPRPKARAGPAQYFSENI